MIIQMFEKLWMKLFGINGYCTNCGRPIFNLDSKWADYNMCVYCWSAYMLGRHEKECENET